MKTKHTPTPWRQGERHPCRIISDKSGGIVAYTCQPADEGCETERELANAQFIVRAVNCHEMLLEACKQAERALGGLKGQCDEREWREDWSNLPAALDRLSAAIAKAEGA